VAQATGSIRGRPKPRQGRHTFADVLYFSVCRPAGAWRFRIRIQGLASLAKLFSPLRGWGFHLCNRSPDTLDPEIRHRLCGRQLFVAEVGDEHAAGAVRDHERWTHGHRYGLGCHAAGPEDRQFVGCDRHGITEIGRPRSAMPISSDRPMWTGAPCTAGLARRDLHGANRIGGY